MDIEKIYEIWKEQHECCETRKHGIREELGRNELGDIECWYSEDVESVLPTDTCSHYVEKDYYALVQLFIYDYMGHIDTFNDKYNVNYTRDEIFNWFYDNTVWMIFG